MHTLYPARLVNISFIQSWEFRNYTPERTFEPVQSEDHWRDHEHFNHENSVVLIC